MKLKIIVSRIQKEEFRMYINWKGFTLNPIILASLSLFLFGCGSGGSTSEAPALKTVNGVVSDSSGRQPFANASVTAYAIDAAGNVAKTPLSADGQGKFVLKNAAGNVAKTPLSATVQSDGQGNFALKIPAAYAGGIMLVATETTGAASIDFTSVLPSVSQGQVVVISPATDMVYQYVLVNKGGSFTADNIQKAILVLEPFFGPNFTQIPPPAIGSTPTPAQQQQLVMIQAINSLVKPGTTIANLLNIDPATSIITLGGTTNLAALNSALTASIPTSLPIKPITEPDLSDKTAPSPPPNLAATATSGSVTLTWGAATDNVGVTAYYVYRNGVFISATSKLTYIDTPVKPATTYTYIVKARDIVGNVSAGSTVDVTTLPILAYTISGKITSNGSALSSVFVAISGSGSGVAVTDANGNYTFTGVRAGSYTITPTLAGFAFTPVSRPVVVVTANITGMDFTAVSLTPGTVTGVVTNPDGSVSTTTTYPDGSVTTSTTYPNGTVTATTSYPNGTVTTTTTYPNGSVTVATTYPNGTVTTALTYPAGSVTATTTYPAGSVATTTTNPDGSVTTTTTNPSGAVTTATNYPNGSATTSTTYPDGTVTTSTTNPDGTVTTATTSPSSTVSVSIVFPL
jgi:hypothetical protein